MEFFLKERYVFKGEFYSWVALIDYLLSLQRITLVVKEKVEFSRTHSRMTYLGTVKYLDYYGYEEALYVDDILEKEEETLLAQLHALGTELDAKILETEDL